MHLRHHHPVTTTLNPAIVTSDAVQRLPRLALWLFCAAYVVPGVFGRDPWRGADIAAFGQMLAIAEGRAPWMQPALGGVATGAALLPHWLGAAAIWLSSPWLDPALAARLPFAALLALTLAAVWYATYQFARGDRAQPLAFAFGGEADPVAYARAVADGAVLAMIATLGLLQLGHETTPELAQLAAVAVVQWALAAAPQRRPGSRIVLVFGLPALAACGAPAMALIYGTGALLLYLRSGDSGQRGVWPWLLAAIGCAALVSWPAQAWAWRLGGDFEPMRTARLWLWFLWPGWALGLWTLWRWRRRLDAQHLALPLLGLAVALAACVAMGESDRALMLGLPGLAVLAAFALPTLRRGASAAIDWFSVFFFSAAALAIWIFFTAMQYGLPSAPAATVQRLAPGFAMHLPWPAWAAAAVATLAWLWLVRWRTRRHRDVIWKSLVLPAGGVALGWLLLMTLWLPLLDYARSNRPLVRRLAPYLQAGECVAVPQALASVVAALEYHGRRRVDARRSGVADTRCPVLLVVQLDSAPDALSHAAPRAGWVEVARLRRPTDRHEVTIVYRSDLAARPPAVPAGS
jgi:hypothetical protein